MRTKLPLSNIVQLWRQEEKPLIDDDAVMNSVEKMFVAKNDAQVRCRTSAPLLYPTRHFSELFFCVG